MYWIVRTWNYPEIQDRMMKTELRNIRALEGDLSPLKWKLTTESFQKSKKWNSWHMTSLWTPIWLHLLPYFPISQVHIKLARFWTARGENIRWRLAGWPCYTPLDIILRRKRASKSPLLSGHRWSAWLYKEINHHALFHNSKGFWN